MTKPKTKAKRRQTIATDSNGIERLMRRIREEGLEIVAAETTPQGGYRLTVEHGTQGATSGGDRKSSIRPDRKPAASWG